MFLRELNTSIESLKGVGPQLAHALARAGLINIGTLLSYYPRDWEDRSRRIPLAEFSSHSMICTEITVLAQDWFGFGRMKTLKIHIEDDSARGVLVCFNRSFLEKQLLVGKRYKIWGHFYYKYGEIQSTSFEVEGVEPNVNGRTSKFGAILPVYPLTAALSQGILRRLIKQTLGAYAAPLEDEIPTHIREAHELLPKAKALRAIHFPQSMDELILARRTLIFEELFYLETIVGRRALERRNLKTSGSKQNPNTIANEKDNELPTPEESFSPLQESLLERLPFSLTEGQKNAVAEINKDLGKTYPMARLLQGDVGSGKTLVAFLAALKAIEGGGQAALMAPTELLARQHAENAARLLEPLGIRPAFLTGNIKTAGRSRLLSALKDGEIDLVVGTHALFSRDVFYRDLRLVVVDEQHRFGVLQRSAIMAKGDHPDLIMMSATPIPRTLALTVFGDMDVSVIPDLPPGRKPVKTHLAKQSSEQRVYDFVRKELIAGRQAYFVYPLIEGDGEEEKGSGLKDAQSMVERLSNEVFPGIPCAIVHSRLNDDIKRETMEAFRLGKVSVMVATSVVEVGVDVPNASCMVVEHAERFGLSALHQLRGRVGRGQDQAYCFLVYSDKLSEDGKQRLKVMLEHSDGFIIAEEDLKLRGPGQIVGIEQSGYLSLGIADPVRDGDDLALARKDAFAMLEEDPGLLDAKHRVVAQVLERAPPFSTLNF